MMIRDQTNIDKQILQFKKHIYPYIGDMALSDCETRYWLQCFDRMKDVPVSAGMLFQQCKQALKFCRVRRYAISDALDDLTIADVGKRPGKRDRALSDCEIGQLWKAVNHTTAFMPYYSSWVRILIVFGCRSAEARLSKWNEWDFDKWLWIVPKDHSKTETPIIRPIPEKIRTYLQELKSHNLRTGYLLGELKNTGTVSSWGIRVWKMLNQKQAWTPCILKVG